MGHQKTMIVFDWLVTMIGPYGGHSSVSLTQHYLLKPKSSIPIGTKVEISPKGITLGLKAELEKIIFQSAQSY
jgi:hypothetical protein